PIAPVASLENARCAGECCDSQAVPVDQDLVVAAWTDAAGARSQQPVPHIGEIGIVVRQAIIGMFETMEDGIALPLVRLGKAIDREEPGRTFLTENLGDLLLSPQIEAALLSLAVCIKAGGEAAA